MTGLLEPGQFYYNHHMFLTYRSVPGNGYRLIGEITHLNAHCLYWQNYPYARFPHMKWMHNSAIL